MQKKVLYDFNKFFELKDLLKQNFLNCLMVKSLVSPPLPSPPPPPSGSRHREHTLLSKYWEKSVLVYDISHIFSTKLCSNL